MVLELTAPFRIDVHCHHIPDFYRLALAGQGILTAGGIPIPPWSPTSAVVFMTEFGIQTQIVSISEPGVGFLPTAVARRDMARRVNDYTMAEMVNSANPLLKGRFGGFAVLPIGPLTPTDVQNSCDEATRALTTLGMDGIGLFSAYEGAYLGDPRLDPLMRVLNDHRAVVFVHPVTPVKYPDLHLPTFLYEFTFDTTRAAVNMAYRQIYTRFPNIRWIFAHAGGTLPYVAGRVRMALDQPDLVRGFNPDTFNEANLDFGRHYYDTALSPAPASMKAVRTLTDVSHILFATDYPFAGPVFVVPGDPAPQFKDTFSASERKSVERSNALALFPRVAARVGK